MNFELLDIIIVALYFIFIFGVGLYYTKPHKSSTEYFLAGRNHGWVMVGMSLFATNISSEHVIGLAGAAYSSGLGNLNYELISALACILLAWTFGKYYLRNQIFTLPEFLEKRFNYFCRFYLSIGSVFAYILIKISVMLLAGAIFLEKIAGIDIYTSSIILVVVTGIYTVSGGFTSVVYTSAVQGFIMIGGGIIVTVYSLAEVGGFQNLINQVPTDHLTLLFPTNDADFPWTGVIFGIPILVIWYHCTDQFFVQKFLVAKGLPQARSGSILSSYLKLTPLFLYLIPGLAAGILYPGIRPDDAYPTLVIELLPTGLKGLVIASFLAALMSSLSSAFASCSTMFTLDVYKTLYPKANDFVIVNVGRIMTFVIVIFAIIWVIFIKSFQGGLYQFLQSVTAYIAPPITAVFLIAILWSRANEKGASVGIIGGFLIGSSRFLLEILMSKGVVTQGWLYDYGSIHFLHFAIILFLSTLFLIVVVSYATQLPSMKKLENLTYKYSSDSSLQLSGSSTWNNMNIAFSAFFVVIVIGIYFALEYLI